MDYLSLFHPVPNDVLPEQFHREQLGSRVKAFSQKDGFPQHEEGNEPHFAIIGANLYRFLPPQNELIHIPNAVRKHLYSLFTGTFSHIRITDWGNIRTSDDETENKQRLVDAISEALKQNIIPVIIGGGQDLTWANYLAYKKNKRYFNLLSFDPKPDFDESAEITNEHNFLTPIIFDLDNYMFNYSIVGYQNYLMSPSVIHTMDKLFFELHRLGDIRAKPDHAEPIIRDADCVSVDMGAIKASDAPAVLQPEPNGFYSEEICKMARYCGMTPKLSSFGIYNISPNELSQTTLRLAAQILWHLFDGFYSRMEESTDFASSEFIIYDVATQNEEFEIRFYKNKMTGRWWMSLPLNEEKEIKFSIREFIIPCTEHDYQETLRGEIPERWWKAEKKLNF
jgi:formiminoglutamase